MPDRLLNPVSTALDGNGDPISGAKLNFYETGTSTRKNTYSDEALTSANANPVVADSAGRFGDIFLAAGKYKLVLTDASDVTVWTRDPVEKAGSGTLFGTSNAKTADYTVLSSDDGNLIDVDASAAQTTVTLPVAGTVGAGFCVAVSKSDAGSNSVVVDGNGSETIDGGATYTLAGQYDMALFLCNGTGWYVVGDKWSLSSQAQAEAGTENSTIMTPLRVRRRSRPWEALVT